MTTRGSLHLVAILGLATVFACSDSLAPDDFYGIWGGDEARLTLSETTALFESSCWHGELPIPLVVSGEAFEAVGTIVSQGGAGGSETRFATFRGHLSGERLSLTVDPSSLGLGPYQMTRGAPVSIPGCPVPAGD